MIKSLTCKIERKKMDLPRKKFTIKGLTLSLFFSYTKLKKGSGGKLPKAYPKLDGRFDFSHFVHIKAAKRYS